jgi:hypothetical protein
VTWKRWRKEVREEDEDGVPSHVSLGGNWSHGHGTGLSPWRWSMPTSRSVPYESKLRLVLAAIEGQQYCQWPIINLLILGLVRKRQRLQPIFQLPRRRSNSRERWVHIHWCKYRQCLLPLVPFTSCVLRLSCRQAHINAILYPVHSAETVCAERVAIVKAVVSVC